MRISDWSSDVCSSDLRGVDARILARRHAGLQAVRHVRQRLLLLGLRQLLDLFFDHTGDLHNAFHHRALEYATHRLASGDARIILEPDRMRSAAPGERHRRLMQIGEHTSVPPAPMPNLVSLLLLKKQKTT